MTRPRSPAAQALTDQADVAARDGTVILAGLAGQLDSHITTGVPDGPVSGILARFAHRYLAGEIGHCPHLAGGPEPSWWLPGKPGRLRCLRCARRASDTTPPRRERCDHCRRVRRPLHAGLVMVPPIIREDLTGSAEAVGPIAIAFQLCPACQNTPSPQNRSTT